MENSLMSLSTIDRLRNPVISPNVPLHCSRHVKGVWPHGSLYVFQLSSHKQYPETAASIVSSQPYDSYSLVAPHKHFLDLPLAASSANGRRLKEATLSRMNRSDRWNSKVPTCDCTKKEESEQDHFEGDGFVHLLNWRMEANNNSNEIGSQSPEERRCSD